MEDLLVNDLDYAHVIREEIDVRISKLVGEHGYSDVNRVKLKKRMCANTAWRWGSNLRSGLAIGGT